MFGLISRISTYKGVWFLGCFFLACCMFCIFWLLLFLFAFVFIFQPIFMNCIFYVPYKILSFSRYIKVVKMRTNTEHNICVLFFILNQPGRRSFSSTIICCVDYQPLYMYTCVKFCISQ